jgi:tRNA(Ile)-lysidine synthase
MNVGLTGLKPGVYIVAVSGGVDSMTLLDVLCRRADLTLHVAHVNHGMRPDSGQDEKLVVSYCASHNIKYTVKKLSLGEGASEAVAREARYKFMRQCRNKYKAEAIITAHHQDDLIETALINIIRGTGWRGLAPFALNSDILRPLINTKKEDIRHYASAHALSWREDSTNTDERYLRNYVRQTFIPALTKRSTEWESSFLRLIRNQQELRRTIEDELKVKLTLCVAVNSTTPTLHRYYWIMLPQEEAYELFQTVCRQYLAHSVVRALALQALLFIKTARPGKLMPLGSQWQLRALADQIIVEPRSSVLS